MYSHYKPLRNSLRRKPLLAGLHAVWVQMKRARPDFGRVNDLGTSPGPWELELLAREIVLNSPGSILARDSSSFFFDISKEINQIRKIANLVSDENIDDFKSAISSLHALIHQQIGWQDDLSFERIYRYIKIYTHHSLKDLIEKNLSISVSDLYAIGLAVAGALNNSPYILASNYAKIPGLTQGAEVAFFKFVSQDLDLFREVIGAEARYDPYWAYTYNPWRGRPLVFDKAAPDYLMGISADLLIWKITDGIFFDICDFDNFSSAWGDAYGAYIGEVLSATLSSSSSFDIYPEIKYSMGKGKPRRGADWIVSDSSGHVFIECKAKRLSMKAKWGTDIQLYDDELNKLAKAFAQNYQNIFEARQGFRPDFEAKGRQMINLVTTLEDWRLSKDDLEGRLKSMILSQLAKRQLPLILTEEVPYYLLGAQQFEERFQNVAEHGVVPSFLSWNDIPKIKRRPLFPNELAKLMPNIAVAAGLDQFGDEYT